MLFTLIRGQTYQTEARFVGTDGNPALPESSAIYSIFDGSGNRLFNGYGIQDINDPAYWRASITIPEDAEETSSLEKYRVIWDLTDTSGNTFTSTEYFMVGSGDPEFAEDSRVTMLLNRQFSDKLHSNYPLSSYSVNIIDRNDKILFTSGILTNPASSFSRGIYTYKYRSPGSIQELVVNNSLGIGPYLINWEYAPDGGESQLEIHELYVLGTKAVSFIFNLRRSLDKALNFDIDPALRFGDAELMGFIFDGLNMINGTGPTYSSWTITSLPLQLESLLMEASKVYALRAWSLAESLRAFDFSGASTSLNIDRSAAIENLLNKIEGEIGQKIEASKRLFVRSKSAGVLGLSIGAHTNLATTRSANYPWISLPLRVSMR